MEVLLNHTYFPSIAAFVLMAKSEKVWFEVHDNYEKQTYRNRTYIYGANGKQTLSIPVNYTQKNRQLYRDVRISHTTPWQSKHKKSIESAYRSSPFFEFYEADLRPLFTKKPKFLMDYNIQCLVVLCACLGLEVNTQNTASFEKDPPTFWDFRTLCQVHTELAPFEPYTQVFSVKHGYLNNLSILDLLFNEGPNSMDYLNSQLIPEMLSN